MKKKNKFFNWRFFTIAITVAICLFAVIYRIFSIQVIDSAFLQNEGAKRHIKYKDIIQ
jgi:Cell division protein FtsI/penicillin-binding protein 2